MTTQPSIHAWTLYIRMYIYEHIYVPLNQITIFENIGMPLAGLETISFYQHAIFKDFKLNIMNRAVFFIGLFWKLNFNRFVTIHWNFASIKIL